jgi:hypothetical protein
VFLSCLPAPDWHSRLLVMLFGSINNNNSPHMFTFSLGSMAMVSIFHTYRNLVMLVLLLARSAGIRRGPCRI